MNLWETLLHPDREELENAERTVVAQAANILQVGEFQLLQLAYRDWFGRDLERALVDNLFTSYMLHDEVPHWARAYARKILDREQQGLVDDQDPSFHAYDHDYRTHTPRGVQQFIIAVMILSFTVGGSILYASLLHRHAEFQFPPYLDERDLKGPPGPAPSPAAWNWGRSDGYVGKQGPDTALGIRPSSLLTRPVPIP